MRRRHHDGPYHGPRHCGPKRRFPGNREDMIARLEEHQRDLEQRTADVADMIRRLREEPATEPGTPEPAPA